MSHIGVSRQPRRVARAWRRAAAGAATVVLAAAALSAVAGTAAAKPGAPALAFTPAPYDYGQVAVGQTASQTFTLANTGTQATGKLQVTLTSSAAFTVTGSTCRAKGLKPGATCTVIVRFAPASTGTATATLAAAGKNRHVTATSALTGAAGLGAAPSHIYWTQTTANAQTSTIWTSGLDGTGAQPLFTTPGQLFGIAVDAAHIYWADTTGGTINIAGLDGSNPHPIVTGQVGPYGVAVDASHIYWADTNGQDGTIKAAALTSTGAGTPTTLVSGLHAPTGVAVDASLREGQLVRHIYWADNRGTDGTISQADLPSGSNPHTIVDSENHPFGVAVDAGHLYWANHFSGSGTLEAGTINTAPLTDTGAGTPTTLVTGQIGPSGVAVDTSHIYWASTGLYAPMAGSINSADLAGAGQQTIVPNLTGPTMVAVGP